MADLRNKTPGEILTDSSVAEFIKQMGISIAEAQVELDKNSMKLVPEYAEQRTGLGGKSLIQLGFQPPFYQYLHADLTVSMQLLLKVGESSGENFDLDFNISSGSGSGSATGAQTRAAQLQLKKSGSTMSVDGKNVTAGQASDDLDAAAEKLADKLRAPEGPFARVFTSSEQGGPVATTVTPTDAKNPLLTENSVAFLPTTSPRNAIIRITAPPPAATATTPTEKFVLASGKEVSVDPPGADSFDHARKLRDAINALTGTPFSAKLLGGNQADAKKAPGALAIALFDTGKANLKPEALSELQRFAAIMTVRNRPLTVFGFADTRGTTGFNKDLGKKRADAVADHLRKSGFTNVEVSPDPNQGESRWEGAEDPANNPQFRRAEVRDRNGEAIYILVEANGSENFGATSTTLAPDQTGANSGNGNGFILVNRAAPPPVATSVTVAGTLVTLSGTAVNDSGQTLAADTPEAYAYNLAKAVNAATTTPKLRATRRGGVVVLSAADKPVTLDLVLTGSKDVVLKAGDGIEISKPLVNLSSGTTDTAKTDSKDGEKTTVAFGVSVGLRASRMYEQSINGNSSISARLIAVPPPDEFLEEIKKVAAEKAGPKPS
jgi:outer membrane protein OmpA-like peptidoglycan-associated protein